MRRLNRNCKMQQQQPSPLCSLPCRSTEPALPGFHQLTPGVQEITSLNRQVADLLETPPRRHRHLAVIAETEAADQAAAGSTVRDGRRSSRCSPCSPASVLQQLKAALAATHQLQHMAAAAAQVLTDAAGGAAAWCWQQHFWL